MLRKVLFAAVLFVLAVFGYTNPIAGGDDDNASEPMVTLYEGTYYMLTTHSDFIGLRTSTDLVNWTPMQQIVARDQWPSWISCCMWTPHMAVVNSKVLFYVAVTPTGDGAAPCIAVIEMSSPTGTPTFQDSCLLSFTTKSFAQDPFIFREDDGKLYMFLRHDERIKVVKLTDDGLALDGEVSDVLLPESAWENGCVAAPWVVKKNGFYYMFYSGSSYRDALHGISVARSTSLTSGYTERMVGPLLAQSLQSSSSGIPYCDPGRPNLIQVGNSHYMIYSAFPSGGPVQELRHTLMEKIFWMEDGWPFAGKQNSPSVKQLPDPLSDEEESLVPDIIIRPSPIPFAVHTHQNYGCWGFGADGVMHSSEDCTNGLFILREGLAGENTFSFQLTGETDTYISYNGENLVKQTFSESARNNMSFIFSPGLDYSLTGEIAITIRPVPSPRQFLRHRDSIIWGDVTDRAVEDVFIKDATWKFLERPCPTGQVYLDTKCTTCPNEQYSDGSGACAQSTPRDNCISYSSTEDACSLCNSGFGVSGQECGPCGEGTYSTNIDKTCKACDSTCVGCNSNTGVCNACSPGTMPSSDGKACGACDDGKYSTLGSECIDCTLADGCTQCSKTDGKCTACDDIYDFDSQASSCKVVCSRVTEEAQCGNFAGCVWNATVPECQVVAQEEPPAPDTQPEPQEEETPAGTTDEGGVNGALIGGIVAGAAVIVAVAVALGIVFSKKAKSAKTDMDYEQDKVQYDPDMELIY